MLEAQVTLAVLCSLFWNVVDSFVGLGWTRRDRGGVVGIATYHGVDGL